MITKRTWYFTAVNFLDFDFLAVKGETPECSPILTLKCWHVSPGSIASNTRKFVNDVRAKAIGHFIFELEKNRKYMRIKNNSNFIKRKVFTDTIF